MNKKNYWNVIFLWTILISFIVSFFINKSYFLKVLHDVIYIFIHQLIFILIIIFVFTFIINLMLNNSKIKNILKGTKNHTKYIISILWWILSTWPIYMWYPFLKEMKKHWLNYWHIATFIYARSVKIPMLAAMIFYFWLKYTIIFNITLIISSVLVWIIIDYIFQMKNNINS